MPIGLIGGAIIAGAVAAGGVGLGKGIAALTPAARAQRRMRKEMTRQAEAAMARGQREGWGYSGAKKRNLIASEMRAYDQASQADRTEQMRQVAMQGVGRGGQIDANRAAVSQARGEMAAQVGARVAAESQAAGQQRKADARNLYMQAQGMNVAAYDRAAAGLSQVFEKGTDAGLATYAAGKQQEHEAAMASTAAQAMQNLRGADVSRYY
jgi:hypothetical protein